MRLIDADAFIDFIRNLTKEPNGFSKTYDESAIVHFVENQPTAYDVEAKVAELGNVAFERFGNDGMGGQKVVALDDIISIVRGKE